MTMDTARLSETLNEEGGTAIRYNSDCGWNFTYTMRTITPNTPPADACLLCYENTCSNPHHTGYRDSPGRAAAITGQWDRTVCVVENSPSSGGSALHNHCGAVKRCLLFWLCY